MILGALALLASHVLVISDCFELDNVTSVSSKTQFFFDPASHYQLADDRMLKNKKVLLVVHGYNYSFEDATRCIGIANRLISRMHDKEGNPLYDYVIGYIWPGYETFFDYDGAVSNASRLKNRLQEHLFNLRNLTPNLDVLAHSLGNWVMLEALNVETTDLYPVVRNFYAMAPAVDAKSTQVNQLLSQAIYNCENLYVLHSNNDHVLKFLYPLTSGRYSLGFGIGDGSNHHDHIQLVDCTSFVLGHGSYFQSNEIYDFIEKSANKLTPSPHEAKKVIIDKGGYVRPSLD